MGRENYLPHYILGIQRNVDINSQVMNQTRHCRQFFGVNSVFRLFDTDQPFCFRILSEHGQGEKSQCTVGYRTGGKSLAANFGYGKREQLTNIVANHVDIGHGNELCQTR